jgi:beta-lactamase class A
MKGSSVSVKDGSKHSGVFEGAVMSRRWMLAAASSVLVAGRVTSAVAADGSVADRLAAIRARVGGRIGVHALDTHTGRRIGLDEDSRFAMASTFKLLLAAAVLSKVDSGELDLTQNVKFSKQDMLSHAPVTSKHLESGSLTIKELCAAVVEVSDNPAANLLLGLVGGPAGVTEFLRGLGDKLTRLDRTELALNSNLPGDPRDTTTPRAMVGSMEQVLTKNVLADSSRRLLTGWLVSASTGLQRIRAGLPEDWKVGDKTGNGANGAANDLAIIWPPGRKPILMAVYMSESSQKTEVLNAAHAEIAREVVGAIVPGSGQRS